MSSGASYTQPPAEDAYTRDTDLLIASPPSYNDVARSQHSPPPQYQQPADAQQLPPAPPQGVTYSKKALDVYLKQPSPEKVSAALIQLLAALHTGSYSIIQVYCKMFRFFQPLRVV